MKLPLKAALAGVLGLILQAQSASASDPYCCDNYPLKVERYVSKTYSPVYDCPRPGCGTHIKLKSGTYLDAACWNGWEGWCEIRSRYLKHMYVPRYALDNGYGGYRYKSYGYKKAYPYDDGYKHGSYKKAGYGYSAYSYKPYKDKGYDDEPYGYKDGPYKSGYDDHDYGKGFKHSYKPSGYKHTAYSYESYGGDGRKSGPYKHDSYGYDPYGDSHKHGSYKSIGYGDDGYDKGHKHGGYYGEGGYKHGGYYDGGHGYEKPETLYDYKPFTEHDYENGDYEE